MASWNVESLKGLLSFYIFQMDVNFGSEVVSVVKNNCYSQLFNAQPLAANLAEIETSMKFTMMMAGKGKLVKYVRRLTYSLAAFERKLYPMESPV